MKITNPLLLSLATCLAHASPLVRPDILNYALTLEHLEAAFWEEGLKNYTQADFVAAGFNDPFYANLQQIAADENSHEEFIANALSAAGASPVARCNYSFPATDVKSFLALSNVLEGSGFNPNNATDLYAAFITLTGPVWAPWKPTEDGQIVVTVPEGVSGQSYLVITQGNQQATDDTILAGPAIVEVGTANATMGMGTSDMSSTASSSMTFTMASATTSSTSALFTGGAGKMATSLGYVLGLSGLAAAALI
ncbi:ferritin-like domain-containing protein [Aspergillus thermomutatus]|uniref:Protein rds1 n=1 Tax=Aspergillus thermomutatus TaxID=41047 RepID=A0A397GYI2_ASPTH|nr:uncharacterized protein CDV56_104687 [Aspergillus thermomutatus]RHZ55409.1 hypothetical protein CDV56_104687 [Aspergillus thermomutatus]